MGRGHFKIPPTLNFNIPWPHDGEVLSKKPDSNVMLRNFFLPFLPLLAIFISILIIQKPDLSFSGVFIFARTIFCTYYDHKSSQLTEVPTDIPNGTTEVNLFDNEIFRIKTNSFLYLAICTDMDLSKNIISEIESDAFQGLSSLTELHLEYNRIKTLANDIWKGLPTLKELWLNRNNISVIKDNTFKDLDKLENLWLDWNNLSVIRMDMFKGLSSLQELSLDHNQISQIKPYTFQHLPNLWALTLADNRIHLIETKALANLLKLKLLYVDKNKLTTLEWTIFDVNDYDDSNSHPFKLEVTLNDNPFQCNQNLCWLKQAEQDQWLTWGRESSITHSPLCTDFPNTLWSNISLGCTVHSK